MDSEQHILFDAQPQCAGNSGGGAAAAVAAAKEPPAAPSAAGAQPQCEQVVESESLYLSIPSRLEWVTRVAEMLRQRVEMCGVCDAERGMQLVVALHEALTNAIVHGNLGISSALKEGPEGAFAQAVAERSADPVLSARRVTLQYEYDCDIGQCRIAIRDEGAGFDHAKWIQKLDSAAEDDGDGDAAPSLLCSGRGILLIRAFVDEVEYHDGGRQIVMTLKAPQHDDSSNRRRQQRKTINKAVRVLPVRDDGTVDWTSAWEAVARNASAGGVALVQSEVNSARRLLVELQEDGRPVYVPAEICHLTALDGGLFQIGCRFSKSGDEQHAVAPPQVPEPVAKLLHTLEDHTQPQHERRAHVRVPYSTQVQIRAAAAGAGAGAGEAGASGGYRTAFSRDLSRGGMAIVASFEMPPGPIDLLVNVPGEPPQALKARVVRCLRVTAGVYDIGCQFT